MLDLPSLTALHWVLLALAAALVGLSKAAVPGISTISIAIFAAILPARQSTGALLVLLIVGDAFALWTYRRHADWPTLRKLVPTVLVGVIGGTVFLALAGDDVVRRVIALVLLAVISVTLARRARASRADAAAAAAAAAQAESRPEARTAEVGERTSRGSAVGHRLQTATYGALGGFTTMVANAGGPVMSMYFLASAFSVKRFLGTSAWFFAVVNLAKLPFSISLGLITPRTLAVDLLLIPAVVGGAFVGRALAPRINQSLFERLVIVGTIAGALYLLLF